MPVDPDLQPLLDLVNAAEPIELGPDSAPALRQVFATMGSMLGPGPASVEVTPVTVDGTAGDVPVRVYRPAGVDHPPVLVWFHGGGFVIGDLDTADRECRLLAEGAGVLVVSVDYPLAPEHPYPAAVRACEDAACWVAGHGDELRADTTRLAVGGDSAGGNLAAVVARRLHERGVPVALQLLVYPVTDVGAYATAVEQRAAGEDPAALRYPSLVENADGYFLTLDTMRYFADCYLEDPALATDPDVSPVRSASLAGLPPAAVLTCEYDPLRDEGEAYAAALTDAGVEVTLHRHAGGIHGLLAMTAVAPTAQEFLTVAVDALRHALR